MTVVNQKTSTTNEPLVPNGDRERIKELLRRRLIECGWKHQVLMLCRDAIKENEIGTITPDTLVARVTPKAEALVPDAVKNELLEKIKIHLLTQKNPLE